MNLHCFNLRFWFSVGVIYGVVGLNSGVLSAIFTTSSVSFPFKETFLGFSLPAFGMRFAGESGYAIGGLIVAREYLTSLSEWFELINNADLTHLEIPLKRLELAVFQRQNSEDSIIDAVVAWEGMFSAKQETTFQASATIIKLLKPELESVKFISNACKSCMDFAAD